MTLRPDTVEDYLRSGCGRCPLGGTPDCKVHAWTEPLRLLREILRASPLTEEVKWSAPCYTIDGRNVAILSALKDCVVLSFFRGAEMQDADGILEKPGANSRFARYIRFTEARSIAARREVVLRYIAEAVELERSGRRAAPAGDAMPTAPPELTERLESDPEFAKAFDALTPGRRRGYLLHFAAAKKPETRRARIVKLMPRIMAGKGWNER